MKTVFKRSLSVILSFILAMSVCVVSFASTEQHDPIIVVSGMGAFPLYSTDKDGNKIQVWAPSGEIIKSTVVSSLKKTVTAKGFVNGVIEALYDEMFSYIACDSDGTSINDVSIPIFDKSVDNYPDDFENSENDEDEVGVIKTLCREYGAENVYFFNYDWRLDPLEHAKDLNKYINNVLSKTNSSTVTLVPCSMGGVVTNSYLYKYGSNKISKILYCLVASRGLDMTGELFNKNIEINTDTLMEYFFSFEMGEVLVQVLISTVQAGLNYTKLGVGLDKLISMLLDRINDKAYNDLLSRTFANFPGIWALVGDEYFESAKTKMFGGEMNQLLEQKINEYHYNVQLNAEPLMKSAKSNNTDIYIIAAYGYVGAPVSKFATEQSDCLIETKNESFGATCANYGETLGNGYKAVGSVCPDESHNHVSTDCVIDASTCMFPEETWFIKNNRHVGLNTNTDCAGLVTYLISTDGADVHSNENYPQFVELNPATGKFKSLTGSEIEQTSTLKSAFSRLIYILNLIVDKIKTYFGF